MKKPSPWCKARMLARLPPSKDTDIFTLYTPTETSDDCAPPDRSGLVDASCWDSYFGPFFSRAYMALQYSGLQD
jgi:hypothetical protein